MKTEHILLLLLLILITLISIDLLTGIWFWNKYNLLFSAENFNNIFTPILTMLATIIYGIALFISIRQNKIILSQSIKPYYEKEIKKLAKRAKKTIIENKIIFPNEKINALNYIRFINKSVFEDEIIGGNNIKFVGLLKSQEYLDDLSRFRNGEELSWGYIENREYIAQLLFLLNFATINPIFFLYSDIKTLIQEINQSKLLQEEKSLLKKRIKSNLLSEYMAFILFLDNSPSKYPPIPLIDASRIMNDKGVEFKTINETNFREHYDWFKKEL